MLKSFNATVLNVASVAIALVTLVLTSCTSGEELEKVARLYGAPEKSFVELTAFNENSPKEVSVPSVSEYSFKNEDNNTVTFKGSNCVINSITVNYGEAIDNRREVKVTAFGTADKLSRSENGTDQVVATCSYTQQVPAIQEPVEENVYTYNVIPTENVTDDGCQKTTSYVVERMLNGELDQTWKFSVYNYEYAAYPGSGDLYTAANPEWNVSISLPEGENATNSLGKVIKVDHGTTVESKAVKAKVWKDGAMVALDEVSVTSTVTNQYYYGDYTFIATSGKRVSCDGNYLLSTTSNVVFTDELTGHTEVLVGAAVGTVKMAKAEYVENPSAKKSISDSEGRNYNYAGDYTISIDVQINGEKVCSSATKLPTYTLAN